MINRKVFGIGFHKTGTTSLGVALEALGFTVCDGAAPVRKALGHRRMMDCLHQHQLQPIFEVAARFEAFTDIPWFALYRDLDERFPGSKFILTRREDSRWLTSALRYFGHTESDLRKWLYGVGRPIGCEEQWLRRYRRHNEDVEAYFRDRPDNLLVVDWERGAGWTELATFLRREAPSRPFPHLTKDRSGPVQTTSVDLSGSIIVLVHPRTGSSLLMQTLRLLGLEVVGDFERPDLPQSANPKGYFEDRNLLRHGLRAKSLSEQPGLLRGRAVKMALQPLVKRRSQEEWEALARPDVSLLVPIRAPAESLVSREMFLGAEEGDRGRSRLFHAWARRHLVDFGYLADWVCATDGARPRPVCIDYREAFDNPVGYVERVAAAAGLRPSPDRVSEAVANIDRTLYRARIDEVDGVRKLANGVRPLERVYDILRSDNPHKWAQLRNSLPPWVFDRMCNDDAQALPLHLK